MADEAPNVSKVVQNGSVSAQLMYEKRTLGYLFRPCFSVRFLANCRLPRGLQKTPRAAHKFFWQRRRDGSRGFLFHSGVRFNGQNPQLPSLRGRRVIRGGVMEAEHLRGAA